MFIARRKTNQVALWCEALEERTVPAAVMHPTYKLFQPTGGVAPHSSPSPTGLSPTTVRQAYGVNLISFGAIVGNGAGQTIAIVDAYDLPTIVSDLAAFDAYYGLPDPPSFLRVNQTGGSTLPPADVVGGWGVETALDVEWAHAIAPGANILLVEATSATFSNMYAAVDYARNYPGVVAVSMSWGSDEASTSSSSDSHFVTPSGHIGVTFFASTGDNGSYSGSGSTTQVIGYPAASANVVGVGGTFLSTSSNNYVSESGWGNGTSSNSAGGSGGGISKYIAQPSYQSGVVTQSSTFRTLPDVSWLADPSSGASIYDAYDDGASTPWNRVGGTSLAAPMWAGLMAVIDQGRATIGLGSLDGRSETLPKLYALPQTDFHDITSGNNGYAAAVGYDLVTGRGSPMLSILVSDMVGVVVPVIGTFTVNPTSVTVGSTITITAGNVTEVGGTISTVKFYLESNGTAGLQPAADTFLGIGTQNGTTWSLNSTASLTAGTYTYYAIATDSSNVPSSVSSATLTTNYLTTTGSLLAWNMTGQFAFGSSPLAASQVMTGVTNSTGLTRGSGVVVTGTASSNAWGGKNWLSTSAAGISGGEFITFGLTVGAGKSASLSSIDMNYRRSSTSPINGLWQYQLNNGSWVTFNTVTNEFTSTSSSGAAMAELSLTGVSALQGLSAGTAVNFRLVPYGGTSTTATWYIYDRTGNDLIINGTLAPSTTTGLISSAGPAVFGDNLTFTATVTPSVGSPAPTGTVTFTIDGVAQSPIAVTTVSGVTTAQFATNTLAVGSHTIIAKYNGDNNFGASTSSAFIEQINALPAPAVTGLLMNGADAPSAAFTESRVTSLVVNFNTAVTIATGAFSLTDGTNTITSAAVGNIVISGSGTNQITLMFTNSGPGIDFGSLADGIWMLTIDRTKVTNVSSAMVANFSQSNIRRLFGDTDGVNGVDADDYLRFVNAFGSLAGDPTYSAALDFDGVNGIDADDYLQFVNRYGIIL